MPPSKTKTPAAAPNQVYGIFLIVLGALLIGFMPTSAKIAYNDGANALTVLLYRSIFGAAGLAIYLVWRRQPVHIGRENRRGAMLAALSHMGAAIGILGSIAYIDVSLASVILFLFPFVVAIVNHTRGVTRLTAPVLGLMVVAIGGLSLALGVSLDGLNMTGLALAFFGAAAIAWMVLSVSDFSSKVGPLQANLHMVLWAALYFAAIAVIAPATGLIAPLAHPAGIAGWLGMAGAGLTFTFGYVCFFVSAEIIGTTRASILSILEPVFIIAVAIIVLGEMLSTLQWVGMALVLGSLFAMELVRARN